MARKEKRTEWTGGVPGRQMIATHVNNWILFSRDRLSVVETKITKDKDEGTLAVQILFTDDTTATVTIEKDAVPWK